ncbi:MAG: hypothetical protein WD153_01685 [Candidatus Paceibacterota bacterium]
MKKWFLVFIYAFGLNLIWENAHHFLYVHYKGEPITELMLFRAAFVDAVIILALIFALQLFAISRRYPSLLILGGVIVSVGIEYWALGIERWEYTYMMPLVPFLVVGLTPTIQLGLIGYFVYRITFRKNNRPT